MSQKIEENRYDHECGRTIMNFASTDAGSASFTQMAMRLRARVAVLPPSTSCSTRSPRDRQRPIFVTRRRNPFLLIVAAPPMSRGGSAGGGRLAIKTGVVGRV